MKLEKILVLDDESSVRAVLSDLLGELNYSVLAVPSIAQARLILKEDTFDLIISDVHLKDGNGLEYLQEIKQMYPTMRLMVMTGFGTLDSAVEALRLGVFDYLVKPVDISRLSVALGRLEEVRKLEAENLYLRQEITPHSSQSVDWGQCLAMLRVKELIDKIAVTSATVLIQGESGTGKEVVAKALHDGSLRSAKPFIRVNCAAITATLLESEFFGHEKGAFTGAVQRREGRFELAHTGTLLLDEISEIPPDLQVKLLRVLQEREFERVGGNKTISVDVRVLATTNRNLLQEVRAGRFREDLYYRLNVVPIEIPPLRERGEDLIRLAEYFGHQFARKHGKKIKALQHEVLMRIKAYAWPGNVRELQNAMERAVILCSEEGSLRPEDFAAVGVTGASATVQDEVGIVTIRKVEQAMILKALERCGNNRTHAAELLGISLRTLRNKINEYRAEGLTVV
ncbi:MAG: sigma-54 dependent transcriptional regulator [Blastochloris sp.]|nr:sigma-54 dependent transcriptional regulator [Blastochloris sp.]